MDNNVTLPTQVMFENSGYCGVTPVYTQARLRHEGTGNVTFQCDNQFCVLNNTRVYYNFTSLGDVTLRQPVEGSYLMALIQDCPSGTVLRMTYDVTFTNNDSKWGTGEIVCTCSLIGDYTASLNNNLRLSIEMYVQYIEPQIKDTPNKGHNRKKTSLYKGYTLRSLLY